VTAIKDEFRFYRIWFYAAAIYNALWGVAVVLFPGRLIALVGLNPTTANPQILQSSNPAVLPLIQVIGMMVGVYAYGYYLLARDPSRYSGLIWIGLAGKTFGPIGFLYSAFAGALPWTFGWICVFNDLIWWPVFWSFALKHGRHPLDA
jgi:hypothetical protein